MLNETSNSTTAKITFYSALLIALFITMVGWWQGSGTQLATSSDRLVALSRLFGLLAGLSVLLGVLLMSRIPLFEKNFSLEETIELHKLNGYMLLATIVAHTVFVVLGYHTASSTSLWQEFVLLNNSYEDVFKATIGTVIFFCTTFLTLGYVRKHLTYEMWYMTHLTIYIAVALTFLHQINAGGDMIKEQWFKIMWIGLFAIVFGLLGYYRFLKMFIHARTYNFKVNRIVKEAEDIYSIYISGNNVADFEFIPGQYASWRFLNKSMWFEAHPFSFSQAPGQNTLRITAKAYGDFSEKLSKLEPGTPVLVDGPRGAFTSHQARKNSITLLAGGIGVAPFMSKIPGFLQTGKHVKLLYSVRNAESLAFLNEIKEFQNRGLEVQVFVSSRGERIDRNTLLSTIHKQTTVFICGPESMTRDLPKELIELGLSKNNIVTERFGF